MSSAKLIAQNGFGLIIRSFASTPELVPDQVNKVVNLVKRALETRIEGMFLFRRIDVLIPTDGRFGDCDCGDTSKELRKVLYELEDSTPRTFVSEVTHGDIFCGVLNYGITRQLKHGIDYSMIVSTQVSSYFNNETIEKMLEAIDSGALVVGIALNELTDSIMAGRIANTFALWNNESLMSVSGFDLRAAKPRKDNKTTLFLEGWSPEKEEKEGDGSVFYHLAGVEEIIPLIRIVRTFGNKIAPIFPQGKNAKEWVAPNPKDDPIGYARHLKKMGTKLQRQTAFAAFENADLSLLEGGVMPQYRK